MGCRTRITDHFLRSDNKPTVLKQRDDVKIYPFPQKSDPIL